MWGDLFICVTHAFLCALPCGDTREERTMPAPAPLSLKNHLLKRCVQEPGIIQLFLGDEPSAAITLESSS